MLETAPDNSRRTAGIEAADVMPAGTPLAEFVSMIPIAFARRFALLGLAPSTLAIGDAGSLPQVDVVSRLLGQPLRPILVPKDQLLRAINTAYEQPTGQAQAMIDRLDRRDVLKDLEQLRSREDLLDTAARAPVIKLVNLILFEAVQSEASDTHLQPHEDRVIVRTRIDGVLYDSFELPKNVQEEVISRVKVMGRMNIAEKRLAQDGRSTVKIGDRLIDLRIASLPSSFGERIVIRLLDKSARLYELTELGMDAKTLSVFRKLIAMEHGLILVTGPTGSGKSTTLYAALKQLNTREKNVLTLEDPIEYQLEGISQTQVSDKKGMTFATGLRNVLRQDPDVIMVGEIRDAETATMAIQSSLTGHIVFSTLHTNDAASAVTRMLDLGIEPYLVASSAVGVLAQRLVRRVCNKCAEPYEATALDLQWLGVTREQAGGMRIGKGCEACRHTAYRGRVGVFELLPIDEATRELIAARATASDIRAAAVRRGVKLLRNDGIGKILAGQTTIAEVERITADVVSNEAMIG
jgi:general secretion pathway protein E